MPMRAIKGITPVKSNTKEDIWQASSFLVTEMCSKNQVHKEDLCTIIFSSTKDLTAACPSNGVSELPFFTKNPFPFFDTQHVDVDDGRHMCIRVLILADLDKSYKDVIHIDLFKSRD